MERGKLRKENYALLNNSYRVITNNLENYFNA